MSETKCAYEGCLKASRAKGFCDTHYRKMLRRSRGVGGVEPKDARVYKVRVRALIGTQPHYYSDARKALAFVAKARAEGTLLYFAEYKFERELT